MDTVKTIQHYANEMRELMGAIISRSPAGSHWKHETRGGSYRVVAPVDLQIDEGVTPRDGDTFVLYQGDGTGIYHARHPDKFVDGRFTKIGTDKPLTDNFLSAVSAEYDHQKERWGSAHDRSKSAESWLFLIGYLAGKACRSAIVGDKEKALHHCVSAAAALMQWFDAIKADTSGSGSGEDADLQFAVTCPATGLPCVRGCAAASNCG